MRPMEEDIALARQILSLKEEDQQEVFKFIKSLIDSKEQTPADRV